MSNQIPQHIAIIMDGNGRWAKKRRLPRLAGHREGANAVKRTIEAAQQLGIKFLTLYAFSTENWSRPQQEIDGLMDLLAKTLDSYTRQARQQNYRLVISGSREKLSEELLKKIDTAVTVTAPNTGLTVNLALNYGGRQEIIHAVNTLLSEGKKEISMQDITAHLYQPGIPEPELIIRTSGEERISNFLLWQAAYSEFYFTPVLWPDFNAEELQKAIDTYLKRTRRFGGV